MLETNLGALYDRLNEHGLVAKVDFTHGSSTRTLFTAIGSAIQSKLQLGGFTLPACPNTTPAIEGQYEGQLWELLNSSRRGTRYKFIQSESITTTAHFTERSLKPLLNKPGHPRRTGQDKRLLYVGESTLLLHWHLLNERNLNSTKTRVHHGAAPQPFANHITSPNRYKLGRNALLHITAHPL